MEFFGALMASMVCNVLVLRYSELIAVLLGECCLFLIGLDGCQEKWCHSLSYLFTLARCKLYLIWFKSHVSSRVKTAQWQLINANANIRLPMFTQSSPLRRPLPRSMTSSILPQGTRGFGLPFPECGAIVFPCTPYIFLVSFLKRWDDKHQKENLWSSVKGSRLECALLVCIVSVLYQAWAVPVGRSRPRAIMYQPPIAADRKVPTLLTSAEGSLGKYWNVKKYTICPSLNHHSVLICPSVSHTQTEGLVHTH